MLKISAPPKELILFFAQCYRMKAFAERKSGNPEYGIDWKRKTSKISDFLMEKNLIYNL